MLYLLSSFAFLMYLLWSYLPAPFLHGLGIRYYPDRWWALAAPAFLVTALCYIYVALASYNVGYLTLPLQSVECLVDGAANIAVADENGNIVRGDRPSWRSPSPSGRHGSKAATPKPKSGPRGGREILSSPSANRPIEWRSLWNEGTDAVMDVPIGGICEILYGGYESDMYDGKE